MEGGSITSSSSSGEIEGHEMVGGLVGCMNDSSISDSFFPGNVKGHIWEIGGLVGWMREGSIKNSSVTGDVTGSNVVGGLVGNLEGGSISDSSFSGNIKGFFDEEDYYLSGA
ncbi:MAG: hypothetical protein LBE57_07290, partial [Methanosarcinales archaeon]|nr:hypothetical protein [Methanosarcinales archaeon]